MGDESASLHIPSTADPLPVNWHWDRLDNICEGVFDCPHSTPVLTEDGPYVVRSQDIRSGVFLMNQAGKVSEETYRDRISRAEPRYGDILYSREGTYFGIAAEVPQDVRVCLGQRMVLIRPKTSICNFRYLRFWLNSPVMTRHIHGHRDGSVAERLNLPTIRQLPIALPPPPEQQAIAHILGTLDDKIELNRRMNETLESMARVLFKSWFVDFDPVRAKAEGRNTGLPEEIVNLFPDSFEDSELGKMPKEWEVRKLGDLLELGYGKALKAENRHEGNIPVYGSNGQVGWHDETLVDGPGIVVGRKGNPGVVTWAPTDFYVIDTAFYVIPKLSCRSFHFLFHALQTHDLASLGADSAVPGLNRNLAYMNAQVLPPRALLDGFDAYARSFAAQVHRNNEQSRTLAAQRDALLPKLLSGELPAHQAEGVRT